MRWRMAPSSTGSLSKPPFCYFLNPTDPRIAPTAALIKALLIGESISRQTGRSWRPS